MKWVKRREAKVVETHNGNRFDFTDCEYLQPLGPDLDYFILQGYEIVDCEDNPNTNAKKVLPPKEEVVPPVEEPKEEGNLVEEVKPAEKPKGKKKKGDK